MVTELKMCVFVFVGKATGNDSCLRRYHKIIVSDISFGRVEGIADYRGQDFSLSSKRCWRHRLRDSASPRIICFPRASWSTKLECMCTCCPPYLAVSVVGDNNQSKQIQVVFLFSFFYFLFHF